MCGRLNVIDDPLCQWVSDVLGIDFKTVSNSDLCPSQQVATIICPGTFQQLDANWGIQPSWANKLLINAQSETVTTKPTFKDAFEYSRCLVPCSGWYEWREDAGKKVKYHFSLNDNKPLLMGGILYNPSSPQLVTLTTDANNKCSEIHNRMPVIIAPEHIDHWFNVAPNELAPLMQAANDELITITK